MIYPPTLYGLWAKVSGGGIYQKQPYGGKTTQNLFYHFSGGYDYGESFETQRYFYGGSLDYTHLNAADSGYKGNVKAIGLGAYGGYIQQEGWVLDGSLRYVYAPMHTNLYQSDVPINFNAHLLILGARAGYRFYPFFTYRTKVVEKCVQKVFCRNARVQAKIKDIHTYLEPYVSLNPGFISGGKVSFTDKQSQSLITAKLNPVPTFISKIGLMGVRRYDYHQGSLNLKALMEYSMDLNLGGKITLNDLSNAPLYNDANHLDHRLGMGLGAQWSSLNESLNLFADFKTEFFGRLNTYWLLSAGLRYKFGQTPQKTSWGKNYRPAPIRKKSSKPNNFLKPYQPPVKNGSDSFYEKNHFKAFPSSNQDLDKKNSKNLIKANPLTPIREQKQMQNQRPLRKINK